MQPSGNSGFKVRQRRQRSLFWEEVKNNNNNSVTAEDFLSHWWTQIQRTPTIN